MIPEVEPPAAGAPAGRLQGSANNFDGLRLVGALAVLFSHQFALSGRLEPRILSLTFGTAGVALFFAVSGYLVSGSWFADPHLGRFAARRALRLLPALAVVTCTISAAAVAWHPLEALRFLQNASALTYWDGAFFPSNPYHQADGSLWTIPLEVRCYAVLAIGALVFRRGIRWPVLAVLLAPLLFPLPLAALGSCFVAGAALRMFPSHGRALVVAAAVIALAWANDVAAIMLLISLGAVELGRRGLPVLRRAGRFGDLSYGVYLWAWPVQQLGVLWLGRDDLRLLFAASITSTLAIAWLSWHVVEAPALALKPRRRG